MDPEATRNEMLEAIDEDDLADAKFFAESLLNWLERDGFAPQTVKRSIPSEWNRLICDHVCREVLRAVNRSRE
jgi:hypothetical protein